MPRVTVTYPYRDPIDLPSWTLLKGSLVSAAQISDALITQLGDKVDDRVLSGAKLRIVANVAVGFDNIDIEAATRRGILVTNTPGVLTDATADLTWALILSVARRVVEGDAMVRTGRFKGWGFDMLRGMELKGKTLGIVGAGRIGKAVAHRAGGFGMRVLTHSRTSGVPLRKLLTQSDVVSIHCPLTPATRHLIGKRELGWMKRSAILINTARGLVVDENALVRAKLAGIGLDVYEHEPEVPEALLRMKNVVLLPHIGSATVETRRRMLAMAVANVRAALAGRRPPNLLNPKAWRAKI